MGELGLGRFDLLHLIEVVLLESEIVDGNRGDGRFERKSILVHWTDKGGGLYFIQKSVFGLILSWPWNLGDIMVESLCA